MEAPGDLPPPRVALLAAPGLGWPDALRASLEAAGLAKLCRDLKAAWKCMRYKESDILPLEAAQRAKLKWGCYNQEQAKKTAL